MAKSTYQLRSITVILGFVLYFLPFQCYTMAPAAPAVPAAQNNKASNDDPVKIQELLTKAKDHYKLQKKAEAIRDYFVPVVTNTAIYSADAYTKGGSSAVIHGVLKPTAIDVMKDGAKYAGKKSIVKILKDGLSVTPHKGQKKIVGWGVDGIIKGIQYRFTQDKSSHWFSRFIIQRWLPSFVQGQVVNFVYKSAISATGIDYPEFVQKRDWLHYFARTLIPSYAMMALHFAYGFGYDYLTNK